MKVRYTRVSTEGQNDIIHTSEKKDDEKLISDKCSGLIPFAERPQGSKLIGMIEIGEVSEVVVARIDRLGRNAYDIQATAKFFAENNVNLRVDDIGMCSLVEGKQNLIFKTVLDLLCNIAQMEKNAIFEKTKKGIEIAKLNGSYKGRVKGSFESKDEFLTKYKNAVKVIQSRTDLPLRDLAKLTDVSPNTVRKIKAYLN